MAVAVQYGTFRICVLRTSHLKPYRTSVPYFSSIFEAYRTKVPYPYHYKNGVPYHAACRTFYQKLRRTVLTYRTAILAFNYSQLQLTLKSLVYKPSQFAHLASASAAFCLCVQKAVAMSEKSGIFEPTAYSSKVSQLFPFKFFLQYMTCHDSSRLRASIGNNYGITIGHTCDCDLRHHNTIVTTNQAAIIIA